MKKTFPFLIGLFSIVLYSSFESGSFDRKALEHTILPRATAQNDTISQPAIDSSQKIYSSVEIEAEYPGGERGWLKYLVKNLRYPDEAVNGNIQGDVVVRFVVGEDGTLSNIVALSGPEELKAEAIRILDHSGKWVPAIQSGKNVASFKNKTVKFRLESH